MDVVGGEGGSVPFECGLRFKLLQERDFFGEVAVLFIEFVEQSSLCFDGIDGEAVLLFDFCLLCGEE